jgi:protein CpxP
MNKLVSRAAPALVAVTFALGGTALAATTSQTANGTAASTTATSPQSSTTANSPQASTTATGTEAQNMGQQTQGMNIKQITQERLNNLREQLHITSSEQPEWKKFEQTSMQNADSLDQLYQQRAQKVPTENAVQNLESFAKIQKQQADDLQQLVPDFKSLYSKLTPQQKEIADQTFREHAEQAQARFSQHMQPKLSSGPMQSSAPTQSKG